MGNPCVCKEQPSSRWVFHAPKPFCLSPLCCLGYISWWDVRPTWMGYFLCTNADTHRNSCRPYTWTLLHKQLYTHTPTHTHLLTAKLGLQFAVMGRYLCNYWFCSDLKHQKCKKPTIMVKIMQPLFLLQWLQHNLLSYWSDLLSWRLHKSEDSSVFKVWLSFKVTAFVKSSRYVGKVSRWNNTWYLYDLYCSVL